MASLVIVSDSIPNKESLSVGYFLAGNGVQLVLPTLLLEVHRHENNFLIQYVVFKFVLLRFFCIYFEYILR